MKTSFQIELNKAIRKTFFPEKRIKEKYKILEILLEACRCILFYEKETKVNGLHKIVLNTDKMNRLFFISETKIYSIAFPFNISYNKDSILISYKNLIDIDSLTITNLLSIIKSPVVTSDHCLDFFDPIVDFEDTQKINYWTLLRDLMLLEDGYIRYDKDEKGYDEALKKKTPHRHPINHIDVFYSNQITFKIGLEHEYNETDLIDTLDSNTDCKYLKPAIGLKI